MVNTKQLCPFCEGTLKSGFLWKHHGGHLMVNDGGFKWFDGKPRKPSHVDTNISVGDTGLMSASVAGFRCENCRKVILDY